MNKYDLTIIGAGMAGVAAAGSAAKLGLKTLLVEKNNYLGGLATGGLVVPMMRSASRGLNTEFFDDLVKCAKEFDAQVTYDGNHGWFDPVLMKIATENLLTSYGANILYQAHPTGYAACEGLIERIEVEVNQAIDSETLSIPIESTYYVDATGGGHFAKLLNCKFWQDTEQRQPSSLRFVLSGVDIPAFRDFIMDFDPDRNTTSAFEVDGAIHLSTACTWDSARNWALTPFFKDAVETNVLKLSDTDYFQLFTVAGHNGSVAFNCPRIKEHSEDAHFSLSNGLIEARQAIWRLLAFCKKYLRGFESAYISNIADMTGVRESGRVKCRYDYTLEDILSEKTFDNAVLHSDYPVDIHSNKKDGSTLREVRPYTLPLESLMAQDYDNLYVAGRCLGADFKAQAALRVQASCMSMGEAIARDVHSKIRGNSSNS
jgi:hypothetical protein